MKKYFLILFCSFAFGQVSNQMVTFTQAQSLGFGLNSGQSSVTSNECLTKAQALAKYNLDASAMSTYTSNQLVPRSVWVFNVTYTPLYWWTDVCNGSTLYIQSGSDGLIYVDTAGSTYTGYAYEYIGTNFNFFFVEYLWSKRNVVNGIVTSISTITTFCALQ